MVSGQSVHTHVRNAVTLVWGLFRFAPIIAWKYSEKEYMTIHEHIDSGCILVNVANALGIKALIVLVLTGIQEWLESALITWGGHEVDVGGTVPKYIHTKPESECLTSRAD